MFYVFFKPRTRANVTFVAVAFWLGFVWLLPLYNWIAQHLIAIAIVSLVLICIGLIVHWAKTAPIATSEDQSPYVN